MEFLNEKFTWIHKVGCVYPMVVVSILPHVEFGPNDHWKDTPQYIYSSEFFIWDSITRGSDCIMFFDLINVEMTWNNYYLRKWPFLRFTNRTRNSFFWFVYLIRKKSFINLNITWVTTPHRTHKYSTFNIVYRRSRANTGRNCSGVPSCGRISQKSLDLICVNLTRKNPNRRKFPILKNCLPCRPQFILLVHCTIR